MTREAPMKDEHEAPRVPQDILELARAWVDEPDCRARVKVNLAIAGLPSVADMVDEGVLMARFILGLAEQKAVQPISAEALALAKQAVDAPPDTRSVEKWAGDLAKETWIVAAASELEDQAKTLQDCNTGPSPDDWGDHEAWVDFQRMMGLVAALRALASRPEVEGIGSPARDSDKHLGDLSLVQGAESQAAPLDGWVSVPRKTLEWCRCRLGQDPDLDLIVELDRLLSAAPPKEAGHE